MKIKLWGVRGSIPTPLSGQTVENKLKKALELAKPGDISSKESIDEFVDSLPFSIKSTFGGNTTAIEVETDSGELFIIDCGSGIINLGRELLRREFSQGKGVANIILTHTHWDHVQGIPFFGPFYFEGNRFNFYSSVPDLRERLDYQHRESHFPIALDYMPARKEFFHVQEDEEFFINGIKLYSKKMHHPGNSYGIRIEEKGKVFVYTSDCEFNIDSIDDIDKYKDFFQDADVVIFDAQYTFEESINKIDWGHSSGAIAIDIADKFNVKNLVFFHHDPAYDDVKLENVLSNARSYMQMIRKVDKFKVEIAYEGMVKII